jgi:hypothetical protein
MNGVMSDTRVRLVIQISEELRDGLRLESARRGLDMQDIVAGWIEEHCADSVAEIRSRDKKEKKPKKKGET